MAEETGATVQVDYAENWACNHQNEISAVYYVKCLVAIHPIVVYSNEKGQAFCQKLCVHLKTVDLAVCNRVPDDAIQEPPNM